MRGDQLNVLLVRWGGMDTQSSVLDRNEITWSNSVSLHQVNKSPSALHLCMFVSSLGKPICIFVQTLLYFCANPSVFFFHCITLHTLPKTPKI